MNISLTPQVFDFSEAETQKICAFAKPYLEKAKAQGQIVKQTHEKNKEFFNGCKVHSAAFPDGIFKWFVKNPIDAERKLTEGEYKDKDDCLCFELTSEGKVRTLPVAARLRFKNGGYSVPDVHYHELLNGLPHIVRLIHHMVYQKFINGKWVKKTVFYMERHDMDLKAYIRSPHFQKEQILTLLRDQLNGLGQFHAKKLIHNDIKLANCLITLKERPHLVLTDFALTVPFDRVRSMGDFISWAPEQSLELNIVANSDRLNIQKKLDHKIEIWALGICLYQMIHGADECPLFAQYNIAALRMYTFFSDFTDLFPVEDERVRPIRMRIEALANAADKLPKASYALHPVHREGREMKLYQEFEALCDKLAGVQTERRFILQDYKKNFPKPREQGELNFRDYKNIYENHPILRSLFAIGRKMIARYLETIPETPSQSLKEDPLHYLLIKMLQPDAAKRLDLPEVLQLIDGMQSKKRTLEEPE